MTEHNHAYETEPGLTEIEFESWWFEQYPAVPRDGNEWGEQFRQIYINARAAWVEAYTRGLNTIRVGNEV